MRNFRFSSLLGLILSVLALTGGGCTHHHDQDTMTAHITTAHQRTDKSWQVSYQLSDTVPGVVFQRQKSQNRIGNWMSLTPGVVIQNVNGREMIYSTSGQLKNFDFKINTYFYDAPRDYEIFTGFSDGSLTLYTGQLDIAPLTCAGLAPCRPEELIDRQMNVGESFRFQPAPGEQVAVDGQSSYDSIDWVPRTAGGFVYFGTLPIQNLGRFSIIADPSLPYWTTSTVKNFIPTVLDFYTGQLGISYDGNPFIYFSYQPNSPSYGTRGGVLNGQMRLTLYGPQWDEVSSSNQEKLSELVAHESAHFWNGDKFTPTGSEENSWMHEGSADAFAYRALLALKVIDRSTYLSLLSSALNSCVSELDGFSIQDSGAYGHSDNYYSCGSTIALMTEAVSSRQGINLFGFWSRLFQAAQQNGGSYSPDMYLQELASFDGETASAVRNLVQSPTFRPDSTFTDALNQAGIATTVDSQHYISIESAP